MRNTDLHIHTNYSDGELSPSSVVKLAKKCKLSGMSITDHDSISGIDDARKEIEKSSIKIIDGIELSSHKGEIIGYCFNRDDSGLNKLILQNQKLRIKKIKARIDYLIDKGVDISLEDTLAETSAPIKNITSTHIASVLVKKGFAKDLPEVFEKYIRNIPTSGTGKATEEKKIIKAICNAGGVAVLPHPWLFKYLRNNLEEQIQKLMEYGLEGIETTGCYHDADKEFVDDVKRISKKYNLIETGGSDFHGYNWIPENILGKYNIDIKVIHKIEEKSSYK